MGESDRPCDVIALRIDNCSLVGLTGPLRQVVLFSVPIDVPTSPVEILRPMSWIHFLT